MFNIRNEWVTIDCPTCNYNVDIRHLDIKLESKVICHNCKDNLQIIDNEASGFRGVNRLSDLLDELTRYFK